MKNLTTIKNVQGYSDSNGNVYLNLGNVARGLGFTQTAKSGNAVVRWERVRGYLAEFGIVPTCGDGENTVLVGKEGLPDFIPENIFYKLCFKASNETARKFQDLVTDEILPEIRKTGYYVAHSQLSPELQAFKHILDAMTKTQLEQMEMKRQIVENTEKVEAAQNTLTVIKETFIKRDDDWRKWAKKLFDSAVESSGTEDYQTMRRETYELLEGRARCDLNARLANLRKRLEQAGATKTHINQMSKLDVIESDCRLKEIYTAVLKELAMRYSD